MDGQILATKLMLELTGARLADGHDRRRRARAPDPPTIRLRDEKVERLLGTAGAARRRAPTILEALEFGVADADGRARRDACPASAATTSRREADLIEEVARLWGLDKLPVTLPSRRGASGRLEPAQRTRRRVEDALIGRGLSEAVGYSFAAPDLPRAPAAARRRTSVRLRNPMSEEQATLRTHAARLAAGRACGATSSRGRPDVRLFEIGAVYFDRPREEPRGALPDRARRTSARCCPARSRPASWREPEPPRADFFAAKAVLAAVLDAIRAPWAVEPARRAVPAPGPRRARAGRRRARRLAGRAAPERQRRRGTSSARPASSSTSRCSSAPRELAPALPGPDVVPVGAPGPRLVVPGRRARPARCSPSCARRAARCCARAEVFDVYPGEERTSLALRLEFRAPDRTLTDEEVAQRRAKIDAAVAERLGGEPRG